MPRSAEPRVESACTLLASESTSVWLATEKGEGKAQDDPNTGWEAEVWRTFIRWAAGDRRARLPVWADRPAVVRFAATSPRLLKPFTAQLASRPYTDRLKHHRLLDTHGTETAMLEVMQVRAADTTKSNAHAQLLRPERLHCRK